MESPSLNPDAEAKVNLLGITEYFSPRFSAPERQVKQHSAVFSLVSTIIGGGVLSLPYAMSKCGLVLGGLMFIFAAAMNGFTVDLLVNSSRRTGLESYERLAFGVFGTPATLIVAAMLFILTFFITIAYIILLGDLVVPILEWLSGLDIGVLGKKLTQIIAIVLVFPLTLKRNFYGLKYAAAFSVVSVVFLCGVLLVKCVIGNLSPEHRVWTMDSKLLTHSHMVSLNISDIIWPSSFLDIVYVFPVIGVAFGCHVNALPIHQELSEPTRKRIRQVTYYTMMICCILFITAAYSGFLFAQQYTCGNILLNFDNDDIWINVGRICLSIVLFTSYPMLVLPCRLAAQKFFDVLIVYYCRRAKADVSIQFNDSETEDDPHAGCSGLLLTPGTKMTQVLKESHIKVLKRKFVRNVSLGDRFEKLDGKESPYTSKASSNGPCAASNRKFFLKTLAIVACSVTVSMFVPSIMVVWTVLGATVAFASSLWVPGMLYLKLRADRPFTLYKFLAFVVTIFGFVATIFCTWQAIVRIDQPDCERV